MISVIIPTMGRPTFGRTLLSVMPQLWPGDEIVVMSDGPNETVKAVCETLLLPYRFTLQSKDSGATQRDAAIAVATGTHLMFLDDDDVYTSSALNEAHLAIRADDRASHIFRMRYGSGSYMKNVVLWHKPVIRLCNVGTPMFVVPKMDYMPEWKGLKTDVHDFEWISRVARRCPPTFQDHVIAVIRPGKDDEEMMGL